MTPEQYDAITATLHAISARQETNEAQHATLMTLVTVGLFCAAVIIAMQIVVIILKVRIYREVIGLLIKIQKEATDVFNLLKINKEYVESGDRKRIESREQTVQEVRAAVGETMRDVAHEIAAGNSSDSILKPPGI